MNAQTEIQSASGTLASLSRKQPAPPGGVAADRRPEWAAGLAIAACAWLLYDMVLHHDVVWQLWIGRQLLGGAELYRDILEVNPPLWFWAAVPIVGAADWLGVSPGSIFVLFMIGTFALSLGLVARLERERTAWERGTLFAILFVVGIAMLLEDFGQREHFTLLASIPYVALIARRSEGSPVSVPLALAIGLLAAAGFALKQ